MLSFWVGVVVGAVGCLVFPIARRSLTGHGDCDNLV